jgi:hypothetical protein
LQQHADDATVMWPADRGDRAAPVTQPLFAPVTQPLPAPVAADVPAQVSERALMLAWVGGVVGLAGLVGLTALVLSGGAGLYANGGAASPVAAAQPLEPSPAPALAVAAEAPRAPFGATAVLDDIVRHRDPQISVNSLPHKERIVIGKDLMQFRVKSSEAGYLYVFFVGTGSEQMHLLLPNALDRDNRIEADTTVSLPRKSWTIGASGPPGANHVVVMVSRVPREFPAAVLKRGATMPEFDLGQLGRAWVDTPATSPVLAGELRCPGGAGCDGSYGATLMRIEEVAAR